MPMAIVVLVKVDLLRRQQGKKHPTEMFYSDRRDVVGCASLGQARLLGREESPDTGEWKRMTRKTEETNRDRDNRQWGKEATHFGA